MVFQSKVSCMSFLILSVKSKVTVIKVILNSYLAYATHLLCVDQLLTCQTAPAQPEHVC